jgi:hypothetical protein
MWWENNVSWAKPTKMWNCRKPYGFYCGTSATGCVSPSMLVYRRVPDHDKT